jgi:hypothetical protein
LIKIRVLLGLDQRMMKQAKYARRRVEKIEIEADFSLPDALAKSVNKRLSYRALFGIV